MREKQKKTSAINWRTLIFLGDEILDFLHYEILDSLKEVKRITKKCEGELGQQFRKAYPDLAQILEDDEKSLQAFTTIEEVQKKIEQLNKFHSETVKKNYVTANPKNLVAFSFFFSFHAGTKTLQDILPLKIVYCWLFNFSEV